jgi:hypothetical protein
MEKLIEVVLEIGGHDKARDADIIKALMVEWNFREDDFSHGRSRPSRRRMVRAEALGTLYDGETAQELVARIERAVWRANGAMCHVAVGTKEVNRYPFDVERPGDEEYGRQIA